MELKYDVKNKGVGMLYCSGCRPRDKQCAFLKKRCDLLLNNHINYCYECKEFPCKNLQRIDKRYQNNYKMSMIDNLQLIKSKGIEYFLETEKQKWNCPECNGIICCHNGICFQCGLDKLRQKKKLYRWEDE